MKVAFFVDVVSNPTKEKIEYFDPYSADRSTIEGPDMENGLKIWNTKGRPANWRAVLKRKNIDVYPPRCHEEVDEVK